MRILVVNAGSSSLKLSIVEGDETTAGRELDAPQAAMDAAAVARAVDELGPFDAIGHRIVHGGERFREPVRIDEDVRAAMGELADLAPLHQAKSLAALDAVSGAAPDIPAVACFDTAFHATLPAAASTYALPTPWRERWGVRRYGFHGLSHAYAARRAARMLGRPATALRLVTCHLGAGASLAAVRDGVSVDTTMGFTPLEGLVMATRSGSVDPGLLLWLLERGDVDIGAMSNALEHESGLLALAGSADMRAVLEARERGDPRAQLAIEVYVHRLRAGIAAMAASLGGLDALVFTGGVGERSPVIRAQAARGLEFLGLTLDPELNERATADADVSGTGAIAALVITAREDLEIAAGVRIALGE